MDDYVVVIKTNDYKGSWVIAQGVGLYSLLLKQEWELLSIPFLQFTYNTDGAASIFLPARNRTHASTEAPPWGSFVRSLHFSTVPVIAQGSTHYWSGLT